jgi:2-keto-4-pentenoate hydratase/2-oxohepta-3-ene-1,7-dioic acid hydratase in catechol pathway
MRIVRHLADGTPSWGVVHGDQVLGTTGTPFVDLVPGEPVGPLADAHLLAPVTPSSIMCVGRNYVSHAEEFGNAVPGEPILFLKPPSSVVGPGAGVHYPELSKRVDPEAELCLVIGKHAHRVSEDDAFSVMTGTPQGVGPVEVGQTISAEIEGLGRLENHVIAEPAA